MSKTALALVIVGAVNWLLVGLLQIDLVATVLGGQASLPSRIIYTIVGLAGLYSISYFFTDRKVT
jgi:uncharacterized protein